MNQDTLSQVYIVVCFNQETLSMQNWWSSSCTDGLTFFLSANNVILSPGNKNGFILPKYFDKVEQYPSGTLYILYTFYAHKHVYLSIIQPL